ncbi:MAG: nucleoside triphosphate pyrophosphohydrolase [Alphaproteobacteria bacterium]|nr:nucleoside triphosphate pyrophosphohydrolase [Alphaproteobacteria bacterium]
MSKSVCKLIEVMKKLRNPVGGCPWDIEQNFKTVAPHTLEEAYEVVEAIENDDYEHLREELGDLLFQVIFHAIMAEEKGFFTFDNVAEEIADKMIERHPHVFGDREAKTAGDVLRNWDADKRAKREKQAADEGKPHSALDGVNTALPAMSRALKLQQRAAGVGFDWSDINDVIAKIHEETAELEAEIKSENAKPDRIEDELGDLMFAVINMARHAGINPEKALRSTNRKFERRFRGIEDSLSTQGRNIKEAGLDEMERLWNEVKKHEKGSL